MRIMLDAMGGDFAPLEPIKGCLEAIKELSFIPVLVGNREKILHCAKENQIDLTGIEILHAENEITMTDSPLSVRSKPDTSLKVGLQALAQKEADAFVSAGSTGAVQTGATLFVHRISGVSRSAIGAILPMRTPTLLLDSGANTSFTSEMLLEYAIMGSTYMSKIFGIREPRVGLLNIGVEEHKGTAVHAEAYALLSQTPSIHFVGNVEANTVPFGACDVLVADGFSGNVLLKTTEGMGKYIFSCVKEVFGRDLGSKIRGALSMKCLRSVKKQFDATEYGGAPLLGISAPVIKAHGNSDAKAVKNAIFQAYRYAESDVVGVIANEIAKRKKTDGDKQEQT